MTSGPGPLWRWCATHLIAPVEICWCGQFLILDVRTPQPARYAELRSLRLDRVAIYVNLPHSIFTGTPAKASGVGHITSDNC